MVQGQGSVRKQKDIPEAIVFTKFLINANGILLYCWDLFVWWTSYSFYLIHSIFKGENPAYVISFKNNNSDVYTDIYRLISSKLGITLETTKLYSSISVWMILTFIHGHNCMRNQKLWCPFSCIFIKYRFGLISKCCHNLLVLEAHAIFFPK